MKIALCNGGLGNQTFQYIFARFVELEGGEPCYLDDAAFFGEYIFHNGYEITKVFPNAKPRLLSECFTGDVWEHMVSRGGIARQMREAGEDFAMVAETEDYQFDGNIVSVPTNQFMPWLAYAKGNIYYHGYWINRNWFKSRQERVLREELQFTPIADDTNKRYEEKILETESVALHVRRGDFLAYGLEAPAENYRKAVETMRERVENAHFFVFSDDMEWCKAHWGEMGLRAGEFTQVEGNGKNGRNYIDMQLMSYCKNVALVNSSSFSYLAALLNRNERFLVCNMTDREL